MCAVANLRWTKTAASNFPGRYVAVGGRLYELISDPSSYVFALRPSALAADDSTA